MHSVSQGRWDNLEVYAKRHGEDALSNKDFTQLYGYRYTNDEDFVRAWDAAGRKGSITPFLVRLEKFRRTRR